MSEFTQFNYFYVFFLLHFYSKERVKNIWIGIEFKVKPTQFFQSCCHLNLPACLNVSHFADFQQISTSGMRDFSQWTLSWYVKEKQCASNVFWFGHLLMRPQTCYFRASFPRKPMLNRVTTLLSKIKFAVFPMILTFSPFFFRHEDNKCAATTTRCTQLKYSDTLFLFLFKNILTMV